MKFNLCSAGLLYPSIFGLWRGIGAVAFTTVMLDDTVLQGVLLFFEQFFLLE